MLLAIVLQFEIVKEFILDKMPLQLLTILTVVGVIGLVAFVLIYKYSKLKIILF